MYDVQNSLSETRVQSRSYLGRLCRAIIMGRDIIRTGIIKEPLSEKEMKRYNETVPYLPPQLAKFGSAGYCLPSQLDADYIRNDFKIYPDDIWIVTPPKCGTTWMQEIVWLLHTDVDLSKSNYNQFYRVPFLEVELILPSFLHVHPQPDFKNLEKNEDNLLKFMTHSFQYVETMQRPRIIKTHLPLELLPRDILDTCKVKRFKISHCALRAEFADSRLIKLSLQLLALSVR